MSDFGGLKYFLESSIPLENQLVCPQGDGDPILVRHWFLPGAVCTAIIYDTYSGQKILLLAPYGRHDTPF